MSIEMENKVFKPLQSYIREHHGYSREELIKTPLYAEFICGPRPAQSKHDYVGSGSGG